MFGQPYGAGWPPQPQFLPGAGLLLYGQPFGPLMAPFLPQAAPQHPNTYQEGT